MKQFLVWKKEDLLRAKDQIERGRKYSEVSKELGVSAYTLRSALAYHELLPKKFGTWQFMETAPKDGSAILLHFDGIDHPVVAFWYDKGSSWVSAWANAPIKLKPDYWTRLPVPPKQA